MNRRIALLALLAAVAPFAAPSRAADEALPPAEKILDRYIEVTGGKAVYDKRKSEISSGHIEFAAGGITGSIVRYAAEPDKYYSAMDIQGLGKVEMGVADGIAWEKSALLGARIKDGEERAQAMREARMNSSYHWRELYTKAETAGVETVDGQECYKVVMTPAAGKPETLYFEKKSGLLRKTSLIAASQMGDVPAELIAAEYKDFGGMLAPSKIIQKAAGQEFTITIDSVKANEPIPADRFALPPEIQALVKK